MKNSVLRDALVSAGLNCSSREKEGRTFISCFKGHTTSKALLQKGGLVGSNGLKDEGFATVNAAIDSPEYTQLKSLISKEPDVYYLQDKNSYWLLCPINEVNQVSLNVQINQINAKHKKNEKKQKSRSNSPDLKLICEEQILELGGEFSKRYIVSNEGFSTLDALKKSANYWALTLSPKPVIEIFKSPDGLFRICEKKPLPSHGKMLSPEVKPRDQDNYQVIFNRLYKRGIHLKYENEITKFLEVIKDIENIIDVKEFKDRLGIPMVVYNPKLNKKVNRFFRMKDQNFNRIESFIVFLLAIDKEALTRQQKKLESIKCKKNEGTDARTILKERKATPKIGLGLETKFKPERIRTYEVKLDKVTKEKTDKHALYTAGWSLNGAFTKE